MHAMPVAHVERQFSPRALVSRARRRRRRRRWRNIERGGSKGDKHAMEGGTDIVLLIERSEFGLKVVSIFLAS